MTEDVTGKRAKPLGPATAPARSTLTIRLRTELRRDIERAAVKYGRSLSEEIEHRLEISFAFKQYIKQEWGDDIFKVAESSAASLSFIENWTGKGWTEDQETFDLFGITIANILKNYRDLVTRAGGRALPQGDLKGKTPDELGQMFAALGGLAPPRLKKPPFPRVAPNEDEADEEGRA